MSRLLPKTTPRRASWRVAVLGLMGALTLLLPLSQVLRFQVEQLAELRAERSRLDPMLRAVAVQRGLLGHAEVAARVLRGRAALEQERRERQAEVDRELASLHGTLMAGHWQRASRESAALQVDWRALALAIAQRRVDAPASGERHQLLLEQAVQVMDLVEARALPSTPDGPTLQARAQQLAARLAEVDRQAAGLRESQAWAGVAMAAAVLGMLLWTGPLRARTAPPSAPAPGSPPDAQRQRRRGRRAGDRSAQPTPSELVALELTRLGQDACATAQPKS